MIEKKNYKEFIFKIKSFEVIFINLSINDLTGVMLITLIKTGHHLYV